MTHDKSGPDNTSQSRRQFLRVGTTATAAAAATIGAPAVIASRREPIKWRMQTHWPTGVFVYETVFEDFAKRVTESTDGELEIETHPPGSVVSTGDTLRAVRRGTLDSAFTFPAYWVGEIPVAGHLNGNLGTFDSITEMEVFMYEMGALNIIREAYAERGVYQVGPIAMGGVAIFATAPIRTMEDFRGFNIRSTGNAGRVFEKMGAAPVMISGDELYQALQTGVVDGAHWGGISGGFSMNFQDVTSYLMRPDLVSPTNGEVFVSKERWDELGSDHKQVVIDAVRATSTDNHTQYLYDDLQKIHDFVDEYGGEIVDMDEAVLEEMRHRSMEVVDEVSERDPDYSGRVGDLLHEFMEMTGKL